MQTKALQSSSLSATKKLSVLSLMAALAFVLTLLIHLPLFPAAPFLSYEPKDVLLVLTGMMFGPLPAAALCLLVPLLELFTSSTTGLIGFVMNAVASLVFVLPVSVLYFRRRSLKSLLLGLLCGVAAMSAVMLLWNYLLTPLYSGMPRAEIVPMLMPVILPFNLIKGIINGGFVLLLYRPLFSALTKAHLLPKTEQSEKKSPLLPVLLALFILASATLLVLALWGLL